MKKIGKQTLGRRLGRLKEKIEEAKSVEQSLKDKGGYVEDRDCILIECSWKTLDTLIKRYEGLKKNIVKK